MLVRYKRNKQTACYDSNNLTNPAGYHWTNGRAARSKAAAAARTLPTSSSVIVLRAIASERICRIFTIKTNVQRRNTNEVQ